MKIISAVLAFGSMLLGNAFAGEDASPKNWKCFTDDTSDPAPFFKPEGVSLQTICNKYPKIDYSRNLKNPAIGGHPRALHWIAMPANIVSTYSLVAIYRGHYIYSVSYTTQPPSRDDLDQLVFVIDEGPEVGYLSQHLRPFFLVDGDNVSNYGSLIISTREHPFIIQIGIGIEGNGMFSTDWNVVITPLGPELVSRTESGRKLPTVTYIYDKNGKIVSTNKTAADQ